MSRLSEERGERSGSTVMSAAPIKEMYYFWLLSRDEQAQAIARFASSGMSESTIATATGLSIAMVRRVLAESSERLRR
jgi:predicted transcriptional regulator